MSTPNWAKLAVEGRAKGHGISWSEAEAQALSEIAVDGTTRAVAAEYVRRGCLTLKDVEEMKANDAATEKKTGHKPVDAMTRDELVQLVQGDGAKPTPAATTVALRDTVKRTVKRTKKS